MSLVFNPPANGTLDFISQLSYINTTTDVGFGGILGLGILLVSFLGVFLITKAFSFERSYMAGSLVALFIGLFLRGASLINDTVFYIVIINLVGAVIMLMIDRSNEGV